MVRKYEFTFALHEIPPNGVPLICKTLKNIYFIYSRLVPQRDATPRYAALRRATPRYAALRRATPRYAALRRATL
jgi:hypothetical protein